MSWRAWAITAWTSVVFILATLLLSNSGDEFAAPRAQPSIVELLMMQLDRSQPGELRLWVLPVGLAGLLLIYAALPTAPSATSKPPTQGRKKRSTLEDTPMDPGRSKFPAYGLEILAAATIALALASAIYNDSWSYSRGWIFQFAAGCGWAVLIARMADRPCIERMLLAGSIVAVAAIAFSFWHRLEHHVQHFAWPIGPVTLTAGMGAIWASAALAQAIGWVPRSARTHTTSRDFLGTGVVLLSAFALLFVSERRGAWLAVLAAGGFATIVVFWRFHQTRWMRRLVVASAVTVFAIVAVFLLIRNRSVDPRASVLTDYRLIYWKDSMAKLAESWWLGYGPDQSVCEMSATLAGQRGAMPTVIGGTIDPEAHNEWVQALFELGGPGGLFYLLIPLATIFLAARTWIRDTSSIPSGALLGFAAGILAIVVSESTSICLRRGGMNVWYWSLIGGTVAWMRSSAGQTVRPTTMPRLVATARLAAVAVAIALCLIVFDQGRRRIAHARGNLEKVRDPRLAIEWLSRAVGRLGTWQTLAVQADLADAQLALSQADANDPSESRRWAKQAVETWREVYDRCPGYPGAAFRLAQSLQRTGDAAGACAVLKQHLAEVNPYEMPANNLYVASCPLSPRETLEHVRRGLRDGEWMAAIEAKLASAFESPDVSQQWPQEVLAAMQAVSADSPGDWADTLAPETLRIEAARFAAVGDYVSAARMQSIAVQAYSRLEREKSIYRRAAFAEAGASLRCATYIFRADPTQLAEALPRLREAERLASFGVRRRSVAGAKPGDEWLGGQFVPAEFPPRLRPLWRFSAMLHLAAGSDMKWVEQRVRWSLPDDQQTPTDAMTNLCTIASELVGIFSRYDPSRRPSHFADLVALAHRADPLPANLSPGR